MINHEKIPRNEIDFIKNRYHTLLILNFKHAIGLSMPKSIEAALLQIITTLTKSSKDLNRVFKVLGYAAASYFLVLTTTTS